MLIYIFIATVAVLLIAHLVLATRATNKHYEAINGWREALQNTGRVSFSFGYIAGRENNRPIPDALYESHKKVVEDDRARYCLSKD